MTPENRKRHLIALGAGVYTVSDVCRILQPGMTSRKVHYWLDTRLLSDPVRWGSRGYPTLLSYRQLLEIRTVQHLREELMFSLPRVRDALAWILQHLFADEWSDLVFTKGPYGQLVASSGDTHVVVPGGQRVLEGTLPELNRQMATTRRAWESQAYVIPGHSFVVADAKVLGGAPTVRGTRIDTAMVANLVERDGYDDDAISQIELVYPGLDRAAIRDALEFEGIHSVA